MSAGGWNHNIHYHGVVLCSVPSSCKRALDVGCGHGLLARRLMRQCDEVVGIDRDRDSIVRAKAVSDSESRVLFVQGDVMTYPFSAGSFDFIAVVATLHHLPLRPALVSFRDLLAPGGVLAVVGLYRAHGLTDHAFAAAALPVSRILRCVRRYEDVTAPVQDPKETLVEIRTACDALLPGAIIKQRLLFRYTLIWRKP